MVYGPLTRTVGRLRMGGTTPPSMQPTKGTAMKEFIKSQTFRAVMLLSALASVSLVLMAGRRW
jgi:hypothetical protein